MKKITLVLTLIVMTIAIGLTSCSNDPSKDEVFMGTYKGLTTYGSIDGGIDVKTNKDGTVTVTKVGNSYTFVFSDGIPNITNIKMESRDDGTSIYNGKGLNKITISKNSLNILYNKDGKNWTANCSRSED